MNKKEIAEKIMKDLGNSCESDTSSSKEHPYDEYWICENCSAKEIESALREIEEKTRIEERNLLADKLEEMAIATYGGKINSPTPVSSDILSAWVKPLRSGERAYGPSTCVQCRKGISAVCRNCFEKSLHERDERAVRIAREMKSKKPFWIRRERACEEIAKQILGGE